MRPITRGATPRDEKGEPKQFSKHNRARKDLIDRLGEYCSYCGTQMPASLAVEHIRPRVSNPDLELQWDNFLLACANCNSTKGHKDVVMDEYFWPDRDNTFRAFVYTEDGLIKVNPSLSDAERDRAQNTIGLTGLNRTPANDSSASNRRWRNRLCAWTMATEARHDLAEQDTDFFRRSIVRNAVTRGFWSVWMTVFADDQDMLRRLIDAFPGTCKDCFDDECHPTHRPSGAL